jgi:ribosomal protein L44E
VGAEPDEDSASSLHDGWRLKERRRRGKRGTRRGKRKGEKKKTQYIANMLKFDARTCKDSL